MDSSQTGIPGEGCWDSWRYGLFLSLLLACAISVSKCSSFIHYSICFTPLFLFLFSHTPFSLSPLGGAVFIFGVFIFLCSWRSSPSITVWPFNDLKITNTCCCIVHILSIFSLFHFFGFEANDLFIDQLICCWAWCNDNDKSNNKIITMTKANFHIWKTKPRPSLAFLNDDCNLCVD